MTDPWTKASGGSTSRSCRVMLRMVCTQMVAYFLVDPRNSNSLASFSLSPVHRLLAIGLERNSIHHRRYNHSRSNSPEHGGHMYRDEDDVESCHVIGPRSIGVDEEEPTRWTATASTTAHSTPLESSFPVRSPSGGLLGLDLALNSVGGAGIAALHDVLTTAATSMIFLELRGNTHNDTAVSPSHSNGNRSNSAESKSSMSSSENPAQRRSSPSTTGQLLREIENTCAERRRSLLQRQQLDFRRRTSAAVAASRSSSSSSSLWPPKVTRNGKTLHHGSAHDDGVCDPGRHRRRPAVGTRNGRCSHNGDDSGGNSGDAACCAGIDIISDAGGGEDALRRLPGCEKSAAKPRPLEGALPMRGYYLSPLLDSCFNLLMLREPAGDPADYTFYVNQTRDKLEQRREIRGQQEQEQQRSRGGGGSGGEGDRGGQSVALSGTLVVAAAARKNDDEKDLAVRTETLDPPLKKGTVGE